MKEMEVIAK